jgi:hypothetical protein
MTPSAINSYSWLSLKLITLLGIAVYAVFAVVMVKQERSMAHVLEEGFEPILRMLTYIHCALTVVLFILALIII